MQLKEKSNVVKFVKSSAPAAEKKKIAWQVAAVTVYILIHAHDWCVSAGCKRFTASAVTQGAFKAAIFHKGVTSALFSEHAVVGWNIILSFFLFFLHWNLLFCPVTINHSSSAGLCEIIHNLFSKYLHCITGQTSPLIMCYRSYSGESST